MTIWKGLFIFYIGVQVGIRLPAAKKAAEQFKDSVGSKVVEFAAQTAADQINRAIFSGYTVHGQGGKEQK